MTTILVVEDDAATVEFLALTDAGYDVVQAGDGQAALAVLAKPFTGEHLLALLPQVQGAAHSPPACWA